MLHVTHLVKCDTCRPTWGRGTPARRGSPAPGRGWGSVVRSAVSPHYHQLNMKKITPVNLKLQALTEWDAGDHDEGGEEEATHNVEEGMHPEIQPTGADQEGAGPEQYL